MPDGQHWQDILVKRFSAAASFPEHCYRNAHTCGIIAAGKQRSGLIWLVVYATEGHDCNVSTRNRLSVVVEIFSTKDRSTDTAT